MHIEPYTANSRYLTLIESAEQAACNAYCPYSRFHVGAALLTSDNKIYTGCNIENASYGGTICAERTAVCKAVSEGNRDFIAIAVIGYHKYRDDMTFCMPCGICRQILAEFAEMNSFQIIVTDRKSIKIYIGTELLPEAFQ